MSFIKLKRTGWYSQDPAKQKRDHGFSLHRSRGVFFYPTTFFNHS